MVATVEVCQSYGGSDGSPASESTISTSTRLASNDQFDPTDTSYPVPIPTGGYNYSYWIHVNLKITNADFTTIDNVLFWSDGTIGWAYGTGGQLVIGTRDSGDHGCSLDVDYELATGTIGTGGDAIENAVNGHTYYNAQGTPVTNVESFTTAGKATIDSSEHTLGNGERCKAIVLQVRVASDATQGEQADETLTFSYDEI